MKRKILSLIVISICLFSLTFTLFACKNEEDTVSSGLSYTLINENSGYEVSGIGECTDENIVIPETYQGLPVVRIGDKAFYDNYLIKTIKIPESVRSIGENAFAFCFNLFSVDLHENIYEIKDETFYCCTSLTQITLPKRLSRIGDFAFGGCEKISSLTMPSNVYKIGKYAFMNCTSLETVDLANVKQIGEKAFISCSSLKEVKIGEFVEGIDALMFEYCHSLTSITVSENNDDYKSIDGNLYSKDGKTLIIYPANKRDEQFVIPDSVQTIGNWAFYQCSFLKKVSIGDNLKIIGHNAFIKCELLESVSMGNNVESIGVRAFYDCDSLKEISLPKKITEIKNETFYSCNVLESIIIPKSVTTIENDTFLGCYSLRSLAFEDASNWYKTDNLANWENQTGGILTDLSNPETNSEMFKGIYGNYRWYKK